MRQYTLEAIDRLLRKHARLGKADTSAHAPMDGTNNAYMSLTAEITVVAVVTLTAC